LQFARVEDALVMEVATVHELVPLTVAKKYPVRQAVGAVALVHVE